MPELEGLAKELSSRIRAEIFRRDADIVIAFLDGEVILSEDRLGKRWVVWASVETFDPQDGPAAARASLEVNARQSLLTGATVGVPYRDGEAIVGRNFSPKSTDPSDFVHEVERFHEFLPMLRNDFRETRLRWSRAAAPVSVVQLGAEVIRV